MYIFEKIYTAVFLGAPKRILLAKIANNNDNKKYLFFFAQKSLTY